MELTQTALLVTVLSALAGGVQMLTPDHWLPTSVLAWQRRWSLGVTAAFAAAVILVHFLAGVVLYILFETVLGRLSDRHLLMFGFGLTLVLTVVRALRFSRMWEVLRLGADKKSCVLIVLSLLGPCESLIPILAKVRHMGMGFLLPGGAFLAGTLVMGGFCTLLARLLWNRPLWLPRSLGWAHSRSAVLPGLASVAVALSLVFATPA